MDVRIVTWEQLSCIEIARNKFDQVRLSVLMTLGSIRADE